MNSESQYASEGSQALRKSVKLYTNDIEVAVQDEESGFSDFSEESADIKTGANTYNLSDLSKKPYSYNDLRKDSDDPSEDSDTSMGKLAEEKQAMELPIPQDFFELVASIPSIEDISLESDVEIELERVSRKSTHSEEHGRFTDPLLGTDLTSSESTPIPEEEAIAESKSESVSTLIHEILMPKLPKEKRIDIKVLEEQDLEHFFDMPTAPPVVPEVNVEDVIKLEIQRQVKEDTKKLLHTIIDQVVTKCEHIDIRTLLNTSLDKEELIELLQNKLSEYTTGLYVNRFLVTKCSMYFYQKGMKRFLTPDKQKQKMLRKKYIEKLHLVDQMMERKVKLEQKFDSKIKNLCSNIIEKEESLARQVEEFEELVLETFTKNKSDEFRKYVESNLVIFREARAELQTARIEFIKRKREDLLLRKKLHKINHLGNDVTIDKVELLEAEVQTQGEKLEAINSDISKKQEEFNYVLHCSAHVAEKIELGNIEAEKLTQELDRIIEKREEMKNATHEIKMERLAIQKEMNELVDAAGGLINKSLLLEDYDVTSSKLVEIRQKNKATREEISRTVKMIEDLECIYMKEENDYYNI